MPDATKNNAILERWAATLAGRGTEPAVLNRNGSVERTFADIEREAGEWAERLGRYKRGAVVGMQMGNSPAWPALILAGMRLGLIPLPLGDYVEGEERNLALKTCGAIALVRGGEVLDVSADASAASTDQNRLTGCEFLKLTSGTTSRPRAILFTARQLVADCDNICDTMGLLPTDINFGVIPFSHSYGFSNLITPLLCRGITLAASEERMPRAILGDLARTGATVFPGMPLFYEKLATLNGTMAQVRLCISAGAPLPARVGQAFSQRFRLKVHTFYGSSECGGIAYDASNETAYEDGFVGQPMRNVDIRMQDDEGRICIKSEAVGLGYFPDPDEAVLAGGSFIPADLIRTADGGMYLAGRATDVINIAGRKLNPAEVEARLAECPGVRQVVVFGVASASRNEEAVACVSGPADADQVLRYARSVLSGWQVPRDVWRVEEVPINDRGKISRRDLARAYAERHRAS